MLLHTLLFWVFTAAVHLITRDKLDSLPSIGKSESTLTEVFYRSNCLDRKWNVISTMECQAGIRGPCDEGQTFRAVPDAPPYEWMDISAKTCPSSIPDGCRKADEDPSEEEEPLSAVKFRHGVCLWSEENHPCRGYPSGYRFHNRKKQCFLADGFLDTGCGFDQMFESANQTHGQCRCRYHDDAMWPEDGRCYKRHTRGPCGAKEWLVFDSERRLICRSTNCPADGEHAEWKVDGRTFCYRLNEQGPCPEGKYLTRGEFQVGCDDYDSEETRRSLLKGPSSGCDPGMVRDKQGRCRRIFTG